MKLLRVLPFALSAILSMPLSSQADENYSGKIESRPEGKVGTWVIAGRALEITEATRLNEDDGPLAVGACAEVHYEGNAVKEIESEDPYKHDGCAN
jgi:hypothetical protein